MSWDFGTNIDILRIPIKRSTCDSLSTWKAGWESLKINPWDSSTVSLSFPQETLRTSSSKLTWVEIKSSIVREYPILHEMYR